MVKLLFLQNIKSQTYHLDGNLETTHHFFQTSNFSNTSTIIKEENNYKNQKLSWKIDNLWLI